MVLIAFPPNIVAAAPIILANSQSAATPAPFQQMVSVDMSKYSSYAASNLQNIEFFYTDGTLIPSWLESGSSSTTATWWLSIANGIGANSSLTVYMGFALQSVNLFDGVTVGEAPQLSGTYGQYDNGAKVFSFYDNFKGTALSGWTSFGGFSGSTSNGETITSSSSWGGIYHELSASLQSNLTADYYGKLVTSQAFDIELSQTATQYGMLENGYAFHWGSASGTEAEIIQWSSSGSTSLATSTPTYSGSYYYGTVMEISTGTVLAQVDYSTVMSASSSTYQGASYVAIGGYTGVEFFVQYVHVRSSPPNGVMPTLLINSVVTKSYSSSKLRTFRIQSLPGYRKSLDTFTDAGGNTFSNPVPITITNKQDTYVPPGFQQMMSLQPLSGVNSEWSNVAFTDRYNNELHSWVESRGSPATIWLLLPFGIGPDSSVTIYMWIGDSSVTWDSFRGEAPNLSTTYGQHDNGADVFTYYSANPTSTTGWTIAGSAGLSTSAPAGSYFSAPNAYYANSAKGDYMYESVSSLAPGTVLTFWVYTTGLGDLFFMCNSSGAGQMARLDGRGSGFPSGQGATASWTSPGNVSSGLAESENTWFKIDVVIGATSSTMYIAPADTAIGTVGTEANAYTFANNGNYLGLVGDQLGSTYITYWNGFVLRSAPPNGVMPSVTVSTSLIPGISSVLITLTNTQSTSTPVGLQVSLDVNWSTYQSSLAPDVGNVRFYDSSNNEMYAWLESGNSNTDTTSKVWLKLTQSIPAGGYITVTMKFLSTTTKYDGVYWGEAPQLSGTYGQYDNGAKVFSFYENFVGTAVPAGWTASGVVDVNNGVTVNPANGVGVIQTNSTYGPNPDTILEFYGDIPSSTSDTQSAVGFITGTVAYNMQVAWTMLDFSGTGDCPITTAYPQTIATNNGTRTALCSLTATGFNLWQIYWPNSSSSYFSYNYGSTGEITTNPSSSLNIGIIGEQDTGSPKIGPIYYFRLRAYPPSGTMPVAAYGSTFTAAASVGRYLTNIVDSAGNLFNNFFKVYVTNTQNVNTVKPFQKLLILPAFAGANGDWSNVMFTDDKFTELPSWVEVRGGLTPSNIWVRLPDGIPANETVTIYGWVGGADVTWTSFRGEASQLSASFGAHDNIAAVMNPGLLFQIYYDATGMVSSIPYLQDTYEAPLINGTVLPYGPLVASTPPFVTPATTSSQDVNGTTQPHTLFYYNCSGGSCFKTYTGGLPPPNPPIPSVTDCQYNAWVLKAIGFVRVKTPGTVFGVLLDDTIFFQVAGVSAGSPQSETSWMSGMLQSIAYIINQKTQEAAVFSSEPVTGIGSFRVVMLYSNSAVCAAALALYSNADPDYYSASPLPNGVDPTVSVYSACTVIAPPKPIKQVRVPPSQNPGIPLSANKDNLFLVQNPCPVL